MYNPFSLQNKRILITGASSGIGKSTAIECSKLGAVITIVGRNAENLNKTFKLLEGEGHQLFIVDLKSREQTLEFISKLTKLDGIVHCAGATFTALFQFIEEQKLRDLMELNFLSPTLITHELLKQKKINREASIVFISSIMGNNVSCAGNSMYSATKGAINGLIKGMAIDLAPKKIRINSVSPGMVETNLLKEQMITAEQLEKDAKENYPLKRYGQPIDIAYAIIYLLSNASSWVTGSNLVIDGGYTLN